MSTEIAVIGLSCRFPGAATAGEFWRLIAGGRVALRRFSDDELAAAGVAEPLRRHPAYVPVNGYLEDIDRFDAGFFGVHRRDAELTDPQQRLFLETAYAALEDAGYAAERLDVPVGVFGGAAPSSYLTHNLLANRALLEGADGEQIADGNFPDFLTTRVAYHLDLKGPAVTVQSACSTSLLAIHLACRSLLDLECDLALAGGAKASIQNDRGYLYQEGHLCSADGACRTFDAAAGGTVFGNGVGVVVLKRLEDAIRDADTILAVIKGSAVTNDGRAKMSFKAPTVAGQVAAIAGALAVADTPADSIQYIEAHGTGTPLGDPIEVRALTQAFAATTARRQYCALGSVKPNVGHLDTAAGVAGLIKAVLCLHHRQLPPMASFRAPNPELHLDQTPFFVNQELRDWVAPGPRRAGVSSFGVGGTNVHVVLEEAPAPEAAEPAAEPASAPPRACQLLLLSARTPTALESVTRDLARCLAEHDAPALADVAYTAAVGRRRFAHRRALVCATADDAARALDRIDPTRLLERASPRPFTELCFVFPDLPGQGEYASTGRGLYRSEPVFRRALDECIELARRRAGVEIGDALIGKDAAWSPGVPRAVLAPALVAVEHALAALWRAWGVAPRAILGEGAGEYAAACAAGILSVGDALELAGARGRFEDRGSAADPRELHTALDRVALRAPAVPVLSTATASWMTADEAIDRARWVRGVQATPRLADATAALTAEDRLHVVVGPGTGLAARLREARGPAGMPRVFGSLAHRRGDAGDDQAYLIGVLGRLWMEGVSPDWTGFYRDQRRSRVSIPSYPFERERFWIDADPASARPGADPGPAPATAAPAPSPAPAATAAAPSPAALEAGLLQVWRQVLGIEAITPERSFFELGGDSLIALRLVRTAEKAGIALSPRLIYAHPTIEQLVRAILADQPAGPVPVASADAASLLTPGQAWLFDQPLADASHYNLSLLVRVPPEVDLPALRAAVGAVLDCHPALRQRFVRTAAGVRAELAPVAVDDVVRAEPIAAATREAEAGAITRIAEDVQRSLDLERGPLLGFRLLHGRGAPLLLAVVHHALVDAMSFQMIIDDVRAALAAIAAGAAPPRRTPSPGYAAWLAQVHAHTRSPALLAELPFWRAQIAAGVPALPRDLTGGANREAETRWARAHADAATTHAALAQIPSRLAIPQAAVVVAAIALALRDWTGASRLALCWVHHGREGLHPGEGSGHWAQVGFLARFVPLHLELPEAGGDAAALRAVADQLAALPHAGTGHMLLRYLSDAGAELAAAPPPEVVINFRGYTAGEPRAAAPEAAELGRALSELKGPSIGPANQRTFLLDIGADATGGELRLRIGYSDAIHRAATIEALAAGICAAIARIARLT